MVFKIRHSRNRCTATWHGPQLRPIKAVNSCTDDHAKQSFKIVADKGEVCLSTTDLAASLSRTDARPARYCAALRTLLGSLRSLGYVTLFLRLGCAALCLLRRSLPLLACGPLRAPLGSLRVSGTSATAITTR
jgi:hypothetical protein